jgi:hypothetical protein
MAVVDQGEEQYDVGAKELVEVDLGRLWLRLEV